jgi:trk system potassium uptake protein TrkA
VLPGTHVIAPITVDRSLAEVRARSEFVGKSLRELNFRQNYGVNIVAIKSREVVSTSGGTERVVVRVNDLPGADDVIQEGDVLVVIGTDDAIQALQTGV